MPDITKKELPKAPGIIGDENIQPVVSSESDNNVPTETVLSSKEEPKIEKPTVSPDQVAEESEAKEAEEIAKAQDEAADEAAAKKDQKFEQGLKEVNQPKTQTEPEVKQGIPLSEPQISETSEIQTPVQSQAEAPSIESVKPAEQPSSTAEATPPPLPSEKISEEENQKKQVDVELTSIPSQTNIIKSESPVIDEKKEEKIVEPTEETRPWWKFWVTKSQENPNPQTEEAAKEKNKEKLEKIAAEHPENKQQNN